MKFNTLLAEEREFILRSLAFCGIRVIVPLSNWQGRFKLSETELADQDIKEIHLLDGAYEGITNPLENMGFSKKGNAGNWSIYCASDEVLNAEGFIGTFKVGHLVMLNLSSGGEKSGTRGFVFRLDEEHLGVITENGTIVTFDPKNQMYHLKALIYMKDTEFKYNFKETSHTVYEFELGLFNCLFI